ncbi:DUF397 domain-containing protein [Streptomyces sp. NPDC014940]|uniref:DUF397 domain-containing protein n=1 Tax=Streptomyces sp. NPDC014940 TaxID=3364932 RepID=UPI0036FC2B89
MTTPTIWKKSSFSGGGEGNDCVEIAEGPTHIRVRDSKAPDRAILTFTAQAFTPFVDALKAPAADAGSVA